MGPALVLLSASLFGAMPIFGKFAYAAGVSPAALLLVRFAVAAAVLATLLLLRPGLRHAEPDRDGAGSGRGGAGPRATAGSPGRPAMPRRRALAIAVGLGSVGYAAQAGLYFSALQRMNASLLSLILYTYPALVTVAAVLLGRDRLTPGRLGALVAASLGTLLVLLGTGHVNFEPVGAMLAFGSAIVYTAYILVSDTVVHRLRPVVLSTLVMTGAAGTLGVRAGFTGGIDLDFRWQGWFWLACIAVVSTVFAMLTFFSGLRRTGPSTTAILSTFEPVVTTALATLTLGETLSAVQLIGGVLVLSAVVVLQLRPLRAGRQAHYAAPTPTEHEPWSTRQLSGAGPGHTGGG